MKVGFIVESLGPSQKSIQIIQSANKMIMQDEYVDVIGFYEKYDRIVLSPSFAIMNLLEAYGMDCPLISTSIETTKIALNCIKATQIYFYVWDFEWTERSYDLEEMIDVYQNPRVELIARSKEHADILEKYWKKPIAVIENFNHEKLTKLISK